MIVYYNGEYLDDRDVKISPFDRGFQYADGVYEVLWTYNRRLFRYEDHMERLKNSLKAIRMDRFEQLDDLKSIFLTLIERNHQSGEVSLYVQVTRGDAFPRTHYFPKTRVPPTFIVITNPITYPDPGGINVILRDDIRWSRCDIKSISLLANVLASQDAAESGAGEAIWVKDGCLTEGAHSNFFAVKEKKVITHPLSNVILPGITRKVVLELCRKLDIPVREEGISRELLNDYDEFFITGTTTEVTPVVRIDDWTVGDGTPGEMTKKIQNAFHEMVQAYGGSGS